MIFYLKEKIIVFLILKIEVISNCIDTLFYLFDCNYAKIMWEKRGET